MKTLPIPVRDDLARCWNLDATRLRFLGGGQDWSDGTLFTAPVVDGEVILKILDFPTEDREALDRAMDRIRFIRLFGDLGCRIVTPLADRSGGLFQTREEGGRFFLAYAYQKIAGRPVAVTDRFVRSGEFYRAVGSELGRLHAAWEGRGLVIRPDGTGTESTALKGWRDEMAFFRNWCQDNEVRGAWDRVRDALEKLPVTTATYGFVHNDAHVWNFLIDPTAGAEPSLAIIDFDVANYHWFLSDCAVALYSFGILATGGIETERCPSAEAMERVTSLFWEGYDRNKSPRTLDLSHLDLFLQYRRCLLFMPFQDQTASNPVRRRRWIDRILEVDKVLFR